MKLLNPAIASSIALALAATAIPAAAQAPAAAAPAQRQLKLSPAAMDYLSPLPPGAPLDGPLNGPAPAPQRDSRNHFAMVSARVQSMDWLELHASGHRRAVFQADGSGAWVQA